MDTFHPFWTLFQKHSLQTLCALNQISRTESYSQLGLLIAIGQDVGQTLHGI